jgi:hypothetical protein
MATIVYAILIVLAYRKTVAGLIAFAQLVVQKMTGNANFPNAAPLLTSISNAIAAYQNAVGLTKTQKDLAGQRSATKAALLTLLHQARDLVRTVAEANPGSALAIAESAGMTLHKRSGRARPLIEVVPAAVSGSVVCRAKAPGIPANYFWSYSTDQKNWTSAPLSMKASLTLSGLTPGLVYSFRYYTTTRKGQSDLSQVYNLMVK